MGRLFASIAAVYAVAFAIGIAIGPVLTPEWNVMDWPYVGRTELSFSMFIDKRSTADGDSTAYLIYQNDSQRFTAVRIEANVRGECWSAESDGDGLRWTKNEDEFVPCQMFDVLERAWDPTLRAQ